jgi:hypothetical protein
MTKKNRESAVNAVMYSALLGLSVPTACGLAVVYQQDPTGWQWVWLAALMCVLAAGVASSIAADHYLDKVTE